MILYVYVCVFGPITDDHLHFTVKVFHGGILNDNCTEYAGGEIHYFDMCSTVSMTIFEVQAMMGELGLIYGHYEMYYLISGNELGVGNILPLETTDDVLTMTDLVLYDKLQIVYVVSKSFSLPSVSEVEEFSFTQYDLDQREERVMEIIDEFDEGKMMRMKMSVFTKIVLIVLQQRVNMVIMFNVK